MTATAPQDVRFGPAAVRLAGLAGVLLGWKPDDFWQATPQDLATALAGLAASADAAPPPDAAMLATLKGMFPDD